MKPIIRSIISFLLSSMTIWFMPLASQDGISTLSYVLAMLFWLFFIVGFLFLRPISRRRKNDRKYKRKSRFALIRFFSNRPAQIFDALMIAGLITVILSLIIHTIPDWITFPAVFVFVFSLEMHGIFNGKNYEYMKAANKG